MCLQLLGVADSICQQYAVHELKVCVISILVYVPVVDKEYIDLPQGWRHPRIVLKFPINQSITFIVQGANRGPTDCQQTVNVKKSLSDIHKRNKQKKQTRY